MPSGKEKRINFTIKELELCHFTPCVLLVLCNRLLSDTWSGHQQLNWFHHQIFMVRKVVKPFSTLRKTGLHSSICNLCGNKKALLSGGFLRINSTARVEGSSNGINGHEFVTKASLKGHQLLY